MSETLSQRVNDITNKLRRSVAFGNVAETEQNITALLDELGLSGQNNQQNGSQSNQSGQGQQNQQNSSQGQSSGNQQGDDSEQSQSSGAGQSDNSQNSQNSTSQQQNQGQGDGQKQDNFDNNGSETNSGQSSAITDMQRGASMIKSGMDASSLKGISNGVNTIEQALQEFNDNGGDSDISNKVQQGLDQIKQGMQAKSKKQIQQGLNTINSAVGDYKQQNMSSDGEDTSGFNSDISDSDKDGEQDDVSPDVEDPSKRMRKAKVTLNGITREFDMISDLTTKNDLTTPKGREQSEQESKEQLAEIDMAIKKAEKQIGESLSKQAGQGGSLTSRNINAVLGAEITNWTALLKNMLNSKRQKVFSKNFPVKARMAVRPDMPGQRAIGEYREIEDIKICIDVSGSVSQSELDFFLSDIASLFNHYKVDGELIYWSTKIGDAGRFHDIQGLVKVQPHSTGGTDVKCVFDYLSGTAKLNGKRELTPIHKQAVFILTDGEFSSNYGEYERAFKGRTYWLIYNNQNFKPLFGKQYAYRKRTN